MVWYDATYGYKKKITIDKTKVLEDCTDFPVLISATDADLKVTGSGGHVQSANGYDIIFTNSTENTKLSHEIETYVSGTGQIAFWVKIPSLSSVNNTIIYMYYGKAGVVANPSTTDTWNANYVVVYHMNDADNSTTVHDSTANANHGTPQIHNNISASGKGEMGNSLYFDGVYLHAGNYIDLPATCHVHWAHTIEMWEKMATWVSTSHRMFSSSDDDASDHVNSMAFTTGEKYDYFSTGGWDIYNAGTLDTNWHKLTSAMNTNDAINIRNATTLGTDASCAIPGEGGSPPIVRIAYGTPLFYVNTYFNGWMDDFRLSNIRRTNNWILTSYNSEQSPSTFMSFDVEEEGGGGGGVCVDSGVRFWDGDEIVTLCRDDASPVKIFDGTTVIGLELVASASNEASNIRVFDGTTIKSIRREI